MRALVVSVSLSLVACGGGTVATRPNEPVAPTCAARDRLVVADDALASCRAAHEGDARWPVRPALDALIARLSTHLASLEPPRAVTSDEAQPLAEQIWSVLDEVRFPAGTQATRDRAEDAAERLLRDREARQAPGATLEAIDAVTAVGVAADPTGNVDPCAAESLAAGEARIEVSACEESE